MNDGLDNGYAAREVTKIAPAVVAKLNVNVVLYAVSIVLGFAKICLYAAKLTTFGKIVYPYSRIALSEDIEIEINSKNGII